jgi:glycosyltransferase involved in cell wall biosynthesis
MLDVLVTCHGHAAQPSFFPEVRGHGLAKHLARSGLSAEFRSLPVPGAECRVLICSEYQGGMDWFDRVLAAPLAEISAERLFCMSAHSLGDRDHFSRDYLDWFAARGGVLCHLAEEPLAPHETWIGLGVDVEALDGDGTARRDTVVFDFAKLVRKPDTVFDPALVEAVRRRLPACRVIGSGPAGAEVAALFDEWVAYGQPHDAYIRALLRHTFAFVSGLLGHRESMGLTVAEAQCAGAAVVAAHGSVKEPMLCPAAHVAYDPDRAEDLADAVAEAFGRDPAAIRAQARERFDFAAVVRRTRAAIGL